MRFKGVDIEEMHLLAIDPELLIVGGTLPPIRRSSVGTEDQDNWFFLQHFGEGIGISIHVP
jgi:hypothetical protein